MSRLNLEELDAVWVSEAIETLTFFFFPGEMKKNKKGEITFEKKKEVIDKKKVDAPEQYLQVARSEEDNKQILSFSLNDEVVATFEFSKSGVNFTTTPKWNRAQMYICIPTDRTWKEIKAETLFGVFKQWLQTERFDDYLVSQATESTYTVAFVNLLLVFLACLCNRQKINEKGETVVIKDWKDLDLNAIAKSYLLSLTKLHNSSPRTKKLFPIRPLLSPAVEPLTPTQPIEENKETEPIVDVVPKEPIPEIQEAIQETETQLTTLEPLPDTSLPVVEIAVATKPEVTPEPKEEPKAKSKKKATDELY